MPKHNMSLIGEIRTLHRAACKITCVITDTFHRHGYHLSFERKANLEYFFLHVK